MNNNPSTIPPAVDDSIAATRRHPNVQMHADIGLVDRSQYETIITNVQSCVFDLTKHLTPGDPFSNTGKLQRRLARECKDKGLKAPTQEMKEEVRQEINQAFEKKYCKTVKPMMGKK